jgi:hypothetical protein
LDKGKLRVLEWAHYLCGYFGENEEFVKEKTINTFAEEYLSQIKEERLSKP